MQGFFCWAVNLYNVLLVHDNIVLFNCSLLIFSKLTFMKDYNVIATRVANSLDPDNAQHVVGPNLDPNCLQRLSADGIGR